MKQEKAKIRIMLASRPQLFSEVIRRMVEHQPDMEVVGEVLDPIKLIGAVREFQVDAVIITLIQTVGEPRICSQLLNEHPLLKVVTLSAEGNTAYLYQSDLPKIRFHEPCEEEILGAIRKYIH